MTNELVVTREITLPFIRRPIRAGCPVDERVFAKYFVLVKKTITFNPSPLIRVPPKRDHLAIEERNFFFFCPLVVSML